MRFLHICRENSKSIVAIFVLAKRLPTSATLKHFFPSKFSEPKWKRAAANQSYFWRKKTLLVGRPLFFFNFVLKDKKNTQYILLCSAHKDLNKRNPLQRKFLPSSLTGAPTQKGRKAKLYAAWACCHHASILYWCKSNTKVITHPISGRTKSKSQNTLCTRTRKSKIISQNTTITRQEQERHLSD